ELSNLGIVLREELRRGFRTRDVQTLSAIAASTQQRIAAGSLLADTDWLDATAGDPNRLCYKLGTYDVAGFPAYCGAIALQYLVHYMIGSSPFTIQEIATQHTHALNQWLEDKEPGSLASVIGHTETHLEGHDTFLRQPNRQFHLID